MVKSNSTNKKAQAWGIDLMVAVAIFSMGIIIFYVYSLNNYNETEEEIEKLFYDGKLISNLILSEGHPEDWNNETVIQIGILNNNKINQTKLEKFYNLSQTNYQKTKELFSTKYDYYFFLENNITINSQTVEGIGKPGTSKNNITVQNLIKVTRFAIYQDKPTTAYVYIWKQENG